MNNIKPLVSVRCLVYNQKPFLRQCLDGILMQKTNFPFEAIIHDDASTDGSAEIIREYAEKYAHIIKPIYETENQYSKRDGSLGRIMDAAIHPDAKYIAFCEGDDYWIDPYKLQKQVDILEKDMQIGLTYSQAKVYIQKYNKFSDSTVGHQFINTEALILSNPIATLTSIVRKDLFFQYKKDIPYNRNWLMGDFPMWLWFSLNSKIVYLQDLTGVYRELEESASHSGDCERFLRFTRSKLDIQLFFIDNYIKSDKVKYKCFLNYYRFNRVNFYLVQGWESQINKASDFYKKNHYYIPFLLGIVYPLAIKNKFLFDTLYKVEKIYWKVILREKIHILTYCKRFLKIN